MCDRQLRGIRLREEDGSTADPAPAGTYLIDGYCFNCHWEGQIPVPKGTMVPWGSKLERLARCEDCGCHSLQRCEEPEEAEEVAVAAETAIVPVPLQPMPFTPLVPDTGNGGIRPTPTPHPVDRPGPFDNPWRTHDHPYRWSNHPNIWMSEITLTHVPSTTGTRVVETMEGNAQQLLAFGVKNVPPCNGISGV